MTVGLPRLKSFMTANDIGELSGKSLSCSGAVTGADRALLLQRIKLAMP